MHARIFLCTIALALVAVAIVPAQGQVDIESQYTLQGLYEGDGWQITLPEGWRGAADPNGTGLGALPPEAIEAANNYESYMTAIIGVTPKAGWQWIEANAYIEGCAIQSASFTKIADQSAKVVDVACDPEAMAAMLQPFSQLRMYQFFANHNGEERLHFALVWAASEEIMDIQLASIEQMMDSIRIEGVSDIKSEQPDLYGLTSNEVTVSAKGQEVSLTLQTYSEVQDLSLDEASKTLSFKAVGNSAGESFTVISISPVLEGPYQVMIDGQAADGSKYYTIEDEQTGETEMVVRHGPNHEVAIIGTQVVPEFLPNMGALIAAGGMGLLLAYRRLKSRHT